MFIDISKLDRLLSKASTLELDLITYHCTMLELCYNKLVKEPKLVEVFARVELNSILNKIENRMKPQRDSKGKFVSKKKQPRDYKGRFTSSPTNRDWASQTIQFDKNVI